MNPPSFDNIAVMGAGAVGCYFGGMLARAGAKVTLIARPAHVEAITRDGLLIDSVAFREHIRLGATVDPESVRGAGLVLFCVKSRDTEAAVRAIAPHLAENAIILGLQNGVDNIERIRAQVPNDVIPAVVYVAAQMTGPGALRHGGRGDLVIGRVDGDAARPETPAQIAAFFAAAKIPVRVSDNIEGELWIKLVLNCAYNAISALSRRSYGPIIENPQARRVMADAVAEIVALAHHKGVRLNEDGLMDSVFGLTKGMPNAISSTLQDIVAGRPTEIDHLNGYVMRESDARGLPAPVNRALYALVKLLEEGQGASAGP